MNKMKELRENQNISVLELSRMTGVSERYLRFIECGAKMPSIKTAYIIAQSLNCSIDELFFTKEMN